jgi:hypothetical protein
MEYELVFVLEGSADLMLNNLIFKISQGSCAFIGSEEIHHIKSEPGSVLGIIKTDALNVKEIVGNNHLTNPILNDNSIAKNIFFDILSGIRLQRTSETDVQSNKKTFHLLLR